MKKKQGGQRNQKNKVYQELKVQRNREPKKRNSLHNYYVENANETQKQKSDMALRQVCGSLAGFLWL